MLTYFKILLDARFAKMEDRGASAVEYGLLIAGIAALVVVAVFTLGHHLNTLFGNTDNQINNPNTGAAPAAG